MNTTLSGTSAALRAVRVCIASVVVVTCLVACGSGGVPIGDAATDGLVATSDAPATESPASQPVAEPAPSQGQAPPDVAPELEALEREFQARVGVGALDTGTGASVEYRAGERFGYASTIKAFVAAEFLRQVPVVERDAHVTWTREEVEAAGYSPVTSEHVQDGLTLAQLAEAAVRQSDNAATNIILGRIGGPAGLGAGLAELGDTVTHVVNDEPALNQVDPGSTHDTTTPAAFTASFTALLEPQNLDAEDLAVLLEWMHGNATGDALVRAGAPDGWAVADKSGGAGGMRNDIALVTPPDRAPIVITVLTEKIDPAARYQDELVARVAEVVLSALG